MQKFLFLLFIIFSIKAIAQIPIDNAISGQKQNMFFSYYNENVILTNENYDTEFSGVIQFLTNDGGVRIIPKNNFKIIIKPITHNNNNLLDGDTTVLGSRENNTSSGQKSINNITIFPVPTTHFLNITSNHGICNYQIHDINGNVKSQKNIPCVENLKIDVSFLSKGNYVLSLQTKNSKIITKNFIKN